MGYIFGMINLDGNPIECSDVKRLSHALMCKQFVETFVMDKSWGMGFRYPENRASKAAILETDKVVLLGDIRLYNEQELKNSFDFTTPQEAFLKAYEKWGKDCANHLNGDFAVVLLERASNAVHLFRDHIGVRPLTFCLQNNTLIFASNEFGIAKSGLAPTSINEKKLINQFFRFKGKYQNTVFQNIYKLIPGCSYSFSNKGLKRYNYWKPEALKINQTISYAEAVVQLRSLLIAATRKRMEPGKTGSHVSGGLDSTGIASILADNLADKKDFYGYSWAPEKFIGDFSGDNEKAFVESFSANKGVHVKYLEINPQEFIEDSILPEFEEMFIEHPIMKMAAKDGVKTIFSGWGGDEFVTLSNRGVFNHLFFSLKWKTLGKFIQKRGIRSSLKAFRTEILPLFVPFGWMHIYQPTDWSNLRFFKSTFILKRFRTLFFQHRKIAFGFGNRTKYMLNLLNFYHLPERMDYWVLNAETYGIDYKYPLLDKDLLEFWLKLPVKFTYQLTQSRSLFRDAMKGILVENVRLRKDKGDDLRITYTQQLMLDGTDYIKSILKNIPRLEHLPYFKPKEFINVLDESKIPLTRKNIKKIQKILLYIRYVQLKKNYWKK